MTLCMSIATPADAARIAEIHMAAFGSNAMLLAQSPTPTIRSELQKSIERKTLADINDFNTTVLVVGVGEEIVSSSEAGDRTSENPNYHPEATYQKSKIISFAKWSHPVGKDDDYVEPPWVWPEGTNWKVLEGWDQKIEETQEKLLGRMPCYRLSFIGTDPVYERRGAASMLLAWGIERCHKEKVPIYLESTIEASPFYMKKGFKLLDTFSLNITGLVEGYDRDMYEEISFLLTPPIELSSSDGSAAMDSCSHATMNIEK